MEASNYNLSYVHHKIPMPSPYPISTLLLRTWATGHSTLFLVTSFYPVACAAEMVGSYMERDYSSAANMAIYCASPLTAAGEQEQFQ
jgi:hypothetical protein